MLEIPTIKSTIQDWIDWYNFLKKKFGKNNAIQIFLTAWGTTGNKEFLSNEKFINFVKANDINVQGFTKSMSAGGVVGTVVVIGGIVFLTVFGSVLFTVLRFLWKVEPEQVVKGIDAYGDARSGGLTKIFKK